MRFARFVAAALSPFAIALLAACSDPVPPTPQGAWTVTFISPGPECSIMGHNMLMGSVTSDKKEKVYFDGEVDNEIGTASVECSVIGTNTFRVDAKATIGGRGLQFIIDSISKAATEENPVPGRLSYASEKTATAFQSPTDSPCQFYFTDKTNEGVAAGRIWVAFKCPQITGQMSTCEIQQGYAIFENCLQTEVTEEE